jgi:energy-coupling factor transporter ATP-binding protein EcfA2
MVLMTAFGLGTAPIMIATGWGGSFLPLVARKRLSWLWALSGALPWIMLDEPTIGQDRATRAALAATIDRLATLGYGVVFITHDDDFASAISHRILRVADETIV